MKNIKEIISILHQQKQTLKTKHGIKEIGIFGSIVRGEQKAESDIDVLVDFDDYPSLLEFMDIEIELTDALNQKVDLVMKSGLKPWVKTSILQEVVYL